jgi:methanogenic corrinoid protein MtbC1
VAVLDIATRDALLSALVERDELGARRAVDDALASGTPVREIYLQLLQPALYELGDRWERGEVSVADEHFASGVIQRVLTVLGERMRRAPRDGRLAVVACSPGELHALGGQMITDFLEAEGWEVLHLGASMPSEDLARLVADERPDVVALSTAMPDRLDGAAEAIVRLAALRPSPFLVVGGLAWRGEETVRATKLGADLLVEDPQTLVEILAERFPSPDGQL